MDQRGVGLITFGYGDCQLCDDWLEMDFYKEIPESKCYLDVTKSPDNRLLAQALGVWGFPATYVVNCDYELLGVVCGLYDVQNRLDSILYLQKTICDISVNHVDKDSTLVMLTASLHALLRYRKGDFVGMKAKAMESLEKGSYIFNNYLMYLAYKEENEPDSVRLYKWRTLRSGKYAKSVVYGNLVDELESISE